MNVQIEKLLIFLKFVEIVLIGIVKAISTTAKVLGKQQQEKDLKLVTNGRTEKKYRPEKIEITFNYILCKEKTYNEFILNVKEENYNI